jgi:hypothetical protein
MLTFRGRREFPEKVGNILMAVWAGDGPAAARRPSQIEESLSDAVPEGGRHDTTSVRQEPKSECLGGDDERIKKTSSHRPLNREKLRSKGYEKPRMGTVAGQKMLPVRWASRR